MAKGIDVFIYQNVTSWIQVKNSGVTFVYVKHSDGGGPASTRADGQVNGAKSVGLPVGGYHYAQFSPTPEAQADILINEIERTGAKDLVPMLDLEAPFSPDNTAKDFGIRFCRRVAARGYQPGVYMNESFAKNLRPDLWDTNPVVWIAKYGGTPVAAAGHYDIHQYSSSGVVPGISASGVDMSESYTNRFFCNSVQNNKKKKEDEMAVIPFEYGPTPVGADGKLTQRCHTFAVPVGKASALVEYAWISVKSANGPIEMVRLMAVASGRPTNQTWVIDKTFNGVRADLDRPRITAGGEDANDPLAYVDQFTVFIKSANNYSIVIETQAK